MGKTNRAGIGFAMIIAFCAWGATNTTFAQTQSDSTGLYQGATKKAKVKRNRIVNPESQVKTGKKVKGKKLHARSYEEEETTTTSTEPPLVPPVYPAQNPQPSQTMSQTSSGDHVSPTSTLGNAREYSLQMAKYRITRRALIAKGYTIPDYDVGNKALHQSLLDFKKANGLGQSTEIDAQTLRALGIDVGKAKKQLRLKE